MLVELADSFTALYHFLWGLWQSPRRWHSGHPVLPVQEVHLPEKETSAHSSLQLLPARLALKLVETLSKPGHVVPSWLHGTETIPGSWERWPPRIPLPGRAAAFPCWGFTGGPGEPAGFLVAPRAVFFGGSEDSRTEVCHCGAANPCVSAAGGLLACVRLRCSKCEIKRWLKCQEGSLKHPR